MAKPSPSYNGNKQLVALGNVIRELRLNMGLSQETFADAVGIDRSYLGGIERGEHNLALMNLVKIANTLGMKVSTLIMKANF